MVQQQAWFPGAMFDVSKVLVGGSALLFTWVPRVWSAFSVWCVADEKFGLSTPPRTSISDPVDSRFPLSTPSLGARRKSSGPRWGQHVKTPVSQGRCSPVRVVQEVSEEERFDLLSDISDQAALLRRGPDAAVEAALVASVRKLGLSASGEETIRSSRALSQGKGGLS